MVFLKALLVLVIGVAVYGALVVNNFDLFFIGFLSFVVVLVVMMVVGMKRNISEHIEENELN